MTSGRSIAIIISSIFFILSHFIDSVTKVRISEQKTKFYLSFFERERSAMPLLPSEATKRIFGEAKNTKNRAKYQINAYQS